MNCHHFTSAYYFLIYSKNLSQKTSRKDKTLEDKHRWQNNIKMDHKETAPKEMDWINLTVDEINMVEDKIKCQDLVNKIMNF